MLEIPEAAVMARQMNTTIQNKTIAQAVAAQSPHGFAWYCGDPAGYPALLNGKTVGCTVNRAGQVEISVQEVVLLFSDGVNLRFHTSAQEQPAKHQLLIEFTDGTALSGTVAMYGGLACFPQGTYDNPYYQMACQKPSPLTEDFSSAYFADLFQTDTEKLSLKAFLATQQRIPGLGNGVLQDILYNAGLHPKRKVATLDADDRAKLYFAVKNTLEEMTRCGGRDTERDLFGNAGGYVTQVSKNTVGQYCPRCGQVIQKQAYLGGSIYFCPSCQK
jgi:formamidopyrimidine-DNA glycosylase